MGVKKYRSISEMPRPERCCNDELIVRIRAVLERAFTLAPPRQIYGITRFRNVDEANAARQQATIARMRGTRGGDE